MTAPHDDGRGVPHDPVERIQVLFDELFQLLAMSKEISRVECVVSARMAGVVAEIGGLKAYIPEYERRKAAQEREP